MAERENRQTLISEETLPTSREKPSAEERELAAADWKGYTVETLHALDV